VRPDEPAVAPPVERLAVYTPGVSFFDPDSDPKEGWRTRAYDIIFQTDTRAGQAFDLGLLTVIVISVIMVCLETVKPFADEHRQGMLVVEWMLTGMFTVEYMMRLIVVRQPRKYALSFMGLIDLITLLASYLSLIFADFQAFQAIRALRLLRVFRVFQLGHMAKEGARLGKALSDSRYKIGVFLGTVLIAIVLQGAIVYFVEHEVNEKFSSIPKAIYWATVTLTTVGYGDISPITPAGQFIATLLMLLGYGIIAVPTGIVTAEIAIAGQRHRDAAEPRPALAHPDNPSHCAGAPPNSAIVVGPVADTGTAIITHT
jgi:voltage-gated potassium channel